MKKLCASLAVAYCAVAVVSALWQHSGTLNYEDFTRAIRSNDLSALRELAGQPGASRVQSSLRATPLHYAATYGSTEAVRILLAAGADPNARNQQDATPL